MKFCNRSSCKSCVMPNSDYCSAECKYTDQHKPIYSGYEDAIRKGEGEPLPSKTFYYTDFSKEELEHLIMCIKERVAFYHQKSKQLETIAQKLDTEIRNK